MYTSRFGYGSKPDTMYRADLKVYTKCLAETAGPLTVLTLLLLNVLHRTFPFFYWSLPESEKGCETVCILVYLYAWYYFGIIFIISKQSNFLQFYRIAIVYFKKKCFSKNFMDQQFLANRNDKPMPRVYLFKLYQVSWQIVQGTMKDLLSFPSCWCTFAYNFPLHCLWGQ